MTRILALNGASGAAGVAFGLLVLEEGTLHGVSETLLPGRDGAGLPLVLEGALRSAGWSAASLDLIAVVVGPGSFTGLRATLALAHGLALGGRAEIVGVTIGEALAPALRARAGGNEIWCVSQARRGRVFIEYPAGDHAIQAAMLDALPVPAGPVLLGGDASELVAQAHAPGLAARVSGLSAPGMDAIAAAAIARRDGRLPPRAAQPLYVDPPEAKLPSAPPP